MVKTILAQMTEHLPSVMEKLVKMVVFSDGCAAQYKSKLPFYHLSNACDKVAMERCYFGSRHDKSACDACGGVIKSAVDDDIRTGNLMIVMPRHYIQFALQLWFSTPQNQLNQE